MDEFKGAIGRRTIVAGLAGALAAPAVVRAQGTYPNKTVRYINPFPAGGATDTLSRIFCAKMSELSGQQWIVENKGGSGGNVGMDALAQSAPDGYTLGLGGIASHAISPTLYAKLPFNAKTDFTFISTMWQLPNMLVVNLDVPAKTVPELIELLRKNPGKYSYGSAGSGTTLHLSGELFKIMAKVDIIHVPYRGGGPAMQDLLAGQIHMIFDNIPGALAQVSCRQGSGAGRNLRQAHARSCRTCRPSPRRCRASTSTRGPRSPAPRSCRPRSSRDCRNCRRRRWRAKTSRPSSSTWPPPRSGAIAGRHPGLPRFRRGPSRADHQGIGRARGVRGPPARVD